MFGQNQLLPPPKFQLIPTCLKHKPKVVYGLIFKSIITGFITLLAHGAVSAQPTEKPLEASAQASIAARFQDLPDVLVQTPAMAANNTGFTSEVELEQFLTALPKSANWRVRPFFKTDRGRDVWLVRIGKSTDSNAPKRKLNVWIIAQQHGNEPAGCEAALELVRRFATQKEFKDKLQYLNVFVVPRANPDGAAIGKRENASKADLNRDHVSLLQPEVAALHRLMKDDLPDLVIDLHEFTVGGRWLERYGALQASDVLIQSASHPMVDKGLKKLSAELFEPELNRTLKQYQLRSFVYHTLNTEGPYSFVQMGGNYAGIARNTFGLYGAISYLVETRGVGIGKDHLQRRVASHVLVVKSLLDSAIQHREAVLSNVSKARAPMTTNLIIDHTAQRESIKLPMIDPQSGADKEVDVEFQNSLNIKPTLERALPIAYLLDASQTAAVDALRNHGITVVSLGDKLAAKLNAGRFMADRYVVQDVRKLAGEFGAAPQRFKTSLVNEQDVFKRGMFYVGLNQPLARIITSALEPESAGSYASLGMLTNSPSGNGLLIGDKIPVWRITHSADAAQPSR
jgi:hypothetical protein